MNIVVLGASGFIGRNFIARLAAEHITPRIITRDKKTNIAGCDMVYVPSFTASRLNPVLRDADVVVNFIGRFPQPYSAQLSTNVDLLSVICTSIDYTHIRQFIHISAAAAYGARSIPPKEADALSPDTTYGLSKQIGEEIIYYFHKLYQLPYVIFRPTNVYGPNAGQGVIYNMIASAKRQNVVRVSGSGKQIRDFIHVDDAIRAIMATIVQKKVNKVYNLSSSETLSVVALGQKIIERVNPAATLAFVKENKGSIQKLTADNSLLRRDLGWKPSWTLDRGIDQVAQSV